MSDFVRFMGARRGVSEVPGQGCFGNVDDGNDFRLIEDQSAAASEAAAGVGAATNHPVGMSLEHVVELYWRWRDWRFIFNYTAFGSTVNENLLEVEGRTREADLCLSGLRSVGLFVGGFYVASLFDQNDPADFQIVFYNGLYWPTLSSDLSSDSFLLDVSTRTDMGSGIVGDPSPVSGEIHMSDGTVYSVPLFVITGAAVITWRIEAENYWPYDDGAGGAVWDVNTGAKL